MKKLTLMAGLMIISLQAKLYAQSDYKKWLSMSKTEQTFDDARYTTIRAFVVLKEGKMILDLGNAEDYAAFKNFDSTLSVFMKDIAFYRDSLAIDPTEHVRIDYVLSENYSFKKIRFKKYKSDGSIFMNRDGEIAKLKFEHDSVCIIMQKSRPGISRKKNAPCTVSYTVKATLLLGNYTDVNKLIADNVLTHIMDTLQVASQPRRKRKNAYIGPFTLFYNPYYNGSYPYGRFGGQRLHRYDMLMPNESWTIKGAFGPSRITFNPQIGAGLIRNTLVPISDIGFQYNKYYKNANPEYAWQNTFRVSATGYYYFGKDAKENIIVNDNWFVNAAIGAIYGRNVTEGWVGRQSDFGIGYLLSPKGGYFKNATFRIFTDIMFVRGLTIVPEVIFTNDFKQIYPGITVKVL